MAAGLGKTPGRETHALVYKTCNLKWKTSLREDTKMVIFLFKDESVVCKKKYRTKIMMLLPED